MSASPLSRLGLSSAAGDEAEPSSGGNRKAVLGLGVVAAAGLALGASLLLGGDDELDGGGLGVVPAAVAATPAPASASPAPSPTPSLRFPDADEVQDGRNPFQALYTERAPGAAPAEGAPAEQPAPVGQPLPGELPASGGTSGGGTSGGGTSSGGRPTSAPVEGPAVPAVALALLRTEGTDTARTAVFTVDGAEQAVAVGEAFGPDGSLLLLSLQQGPDQGGWTAVVQQGSGNPFDVVTGVPVSLA